MLIFGLMASALAGAPTAVPENPLARASSGEVQCYQPDEKRRTCRSIAAYRRLNDGRYANTATVLLASAGPVVLETITPVTVRAGAVCGSIRAEDISAGKLRISNRLLTDDEAAPILARVAQSMAPMINKEICTAYVQSGNGITAKATIGGEYRADTDQKVAWIKPDDGYTVAP